MPYIAAANQPRAGMLFSTLSSTVAAQAILMAGMCVVALTPVGILYRRQARRQAWALRCCGVA
ncbi:MAG: hypothetical protein EXR03_06545 [Pseudolabrys sp.]|nr:hypothetical protein [Pseudolabrys sp.]